MFKEGMIHNPHLDGETFMWQGGSVGVLLSHGYTASSAEVRPLARLLHAEGYTVAGPLLPGHLTTPAEMNRCVWQDWAGAVDALYRRLADQCERVFVGGESMGALLALHTATRHAEVAGLLIYAPALQVAPRVRFLAPLLHRFVPYVKKGTLGTPDLWQGYMVNPVSALVQLLILQRVVRRELPRIRQPLLLVQGRLDRDIDLRGVELLYQTIGSTMKALHWMEHSGHTVILDQELEAVGQLTHQFMQKVLNQ